MPAGRGSSLRVLMVTPRSPLGEGGVERHVIEVGRRLIAAGVQVQVLCANAGGPSTTEHDESGMLIRSVRAWPAKRDYYIAPGIWADMAREPWDVVHIQSYHTFVAPLAMLRARSLEVPYVVTFHGGGHSSQLRHRLRVAQRRALRPLLAHADRLVAVARFELEQYPRELRIPSERFVLIPNGSDLDFGGIAAAAESGHGAVLASIGRLERYKGHHRAIAALPYVLQQRRNAKLLIVGTGRYESALRRQAAELKVEHRVEFTSIPPSDRSAMAALLSRISLVVLLSDFETHPIVGLEAVAAGRRLLVADRAGLAELVADELARGVDPDDTPERIGSAILDELSRPPTLRRVRLPSWAECAEALLEVYRSVA
jgi:glycosyltransferase involved in cell wall biosynthesis